MRRYDTDERIPTLDVAVSEFMNAEDLKRLGALTGEKLPTRKADLAQVIIRHLEGERIRTVAAWTFFLKQKEYVVSQTAMLDLRERSVPRGAEPNLAAPPLGANRAATRWTIYLPLGSSEGPYDIIISTQSGESLFSAKGVARLHNGVTSLPVTVSSSAAPPGRYLLQIRRPGTEWSAYELMLR
jgi:hypothetical protein